MLYMAALGLKQLLLLVLLALRRCLPAASIVLPLCCCIVLGRQLPYCCILHAHIA
jgi:hypothetical protein